MCNRIVGAIFCLCSAILFSARYISATVLISSFQSMDEAIFSNCLKFVGTPLLVASVVALIIGILFIGSEAVKKKNEK